MLLELKDMVKTFSVKGGFWGREVGRVCAVNGVSFQIRKGETLGLVGESGCGKSTLGLAILRLLPFESGQILYKGNDISHYSPKAMLPLRKEMQMVFQDPYASLNPRQTVEHILEEPFIIHREGGKRERKEKVKALLKLVGLSPQDQEKYPHEFSGGQRQRIGIARAIALTPELMIADEPVSALDVSVRGEILNLLMELQDRFHLSLLFISHDLTVVQHVSHRVAVMYLGKLMEVFETPRFGEARHPYTRALVSAIPQRQKIKSRILLSGDVPSPLKPPSGCVFHTRCPYAQPICKEKVPELLPYREGQFAACHFIHDMVPVTEFLPRKGPAS